MTIWTILGIEPTQNKKEIKKAYAKMAKVYHPETHPEQFEQLQEAYQKALEYAKGNPVHQEEPVKVEPETKPETHLEFDVDPIESNVPPIPRSKELFQETKETNKTDNNQYVVENIVSSLPKKIDATTLKDLFENSLVQTYKSDPIFCGKLEKALIKKTFIGTYEEFQVMLKLLDEHGFIQAKKKVEKFQNAYLVSSKQSKVYRAIFIIVVIAVSGALTLFMQNIGGDSEPDDTKQVEPLDIDTDKTMNQLNEPFLNGFTIKDGSLIDENDHVVIENIDDVIYTMSNYIVIHNDQGYLSYDTKTKTSVNLEYNDVVLVQRKEETTTYYLGLNQDGTWYLSDLQGNVLEQLAEDPSLSNDIEVIEY